MEINKTGSAFPDENVPISVKKSREYGLKVAQAIHNYRIWGSGNHFRHAHDQNNINLAYYQGQQAVRDQMGIVGVDGNGDPNSADSWMPYMRFSINNYAFKMVNRVVTEITKDYDPVVQAIDPLAVNRRKEMQARLQLRLMLQDTFTRIQQESGVNPDPDAQISPLVARDMQEIDLQMSLDTKEASALELEMGIMHELERNRYDEIKRQRNTDLVLFGYAAQHVGIGPDGKVEIKRIDPDDAKFPYSPTPNFEKMKWGAHLEKWDVGTLKRFAGSELTEADIIEIMQNTGNTFARNNYFPDDHRREYSEQVDVAKVDVMYFEFYTTDTELYKKKADRYGNVRMRKPDKPKEQRDLLDPVKRSKYEEENGVKVEADTFETQYCGWWVVNTNYVVRWGLKNHIEYRRGNLNQTIPGYKVYAPNMYKGEVMPLMQVMRPLLDDLYEANLKLRQMLYAAVPKGVSIDVGALIGAGFSMGPGQENMTPKDLLDLYFQRGVLIANTGDRTMAGTSYKPIEELENGLPRDFMVLNNHIAVLVERLEDIAGLNKSFLGSTQSSEKGKAVTEYEIMSTQSVLDYLHHANRYLDRETYASVGELHLQTRRYAKNQQYFLDIFGLSHQMLINDLDELGRMDRWYSFDIEPRPTQNDWVQLYQEAKEAIAAGLLDFDDQIMLRRFKSLRQAESYFRMRVKKRKQEMQDMQAQQMQMNAQVQQQSAQMAAQQAAQLEQMKFEREMALKQVELQIAQMNGYYNLLGKAATQEGAMVMQRERLAGEMDRALKSIAMQQQGEMINSAMKAEIDSEEYEKDREVQREVAKKKTPSS